MKKSILIKDIPEYNGPGVYALIDVNGKKYIGSSLHIRARILAHLSSFRKMQCCGESKFGKNYISNYEFCDAIKSGMVFSAVVVAKLHPGANIYDLLDLERYYLSLAGGIERTYNVVHPQIKREKDYALLRVWEVYCNDGTPKCTENIRGIKAKIAERSRPIYYAEKGETKEFNS